MQRPTKMGGLTAGIGRSTAMRAPPLRGPAPTHDPSLRTAIECHPRSAQVPLEEPVERFGEGPCQVGVGACNERDFALSDLYRLPFEEFELAIEVMRDWRLDRYYASRIQLFDVVLNEVLPEELRR